jgi:hypothetical protein
LLIFSSNYQGSSNDSEGFVFLHPSYLVWLESLGREWTIDKVCNFPPGPLYKFNIVRKENTLLRIFLHCRLARKVSPVPNEEGNTSIDLCMFPEEGEKFFVEFQIFLSGKKRDTVFGVLFRHFVDKPEVYKNRGIEED